MRCTRPNSAVPAFRLDCRPITVFDAKQIAELGLFSGRTIDVPSVFIAGKSNSGPYQAPGALETMKSKACTRMLGVK